MGPINPYDLPKKDIMARLSELQIDEGFWGAGSDPIIRGWLRTQYDPDTMPTLAAAEIIGKEGIWLMGWNHQGTGYESLLATIFGETYADDVLSRVARERGQNIPGGLFPDTPRGEHLPIGQTYHVPMEGGKGFTVELLRADDPQIAEAGFKAAITYIHDGQLVFEKPTPDAKPVSYRYLRDTKTGSLIATWDEGRWWTPEESAAFSFMLEVPGLKEIDGYGIGRKTKAKPLPRGPYGTNEGDKWLAPDSDLQNRLDAEGKGMVIIHEIIDGEEKIYVTDNAELIAEATEGHTLWVAERAKEN